MIDYSFFSIHQPWWPYIFILLAGALPTDLWRVLGVLFANRISENSATIVLMRAVATSLVAAVIARFVLYPGGSLEALNIAWRIGAFFVGFISYLIFKKSIVSGIIASQLVIVVGACNQGWW